MGGHEGGGEKYRGKQKGEGSDRGGVYMCMCVSVCMKVRGGGKTFPVLYCPKTGGNKHTYRLRL